MAKYKDQTGHKYGKWTVLRKADQKNSCGQVCWICQCECGTVKAVSGKILRRGKSKSCGCNFKKINIGEVYGYLTVLEDTKKTKNNKKLWKCQCICGNIVEVASTNLTTGNTKSCGKCGVTGKRQRHKLLGKKFGLLTVIEDAGNDKDGNSLWKCQCECGKVKIIKGTNLVNGNVVTCGCGKMSTGEIVIRDILEENNIKYIQEYQPHELNGKRFDFAILNEDNSINRLIEFDGIQHFEEWNRDNNSEDLYGRQLRDQIKNNWAKENNIPLVRIPYWELENINKEILFSNKFLI